MADSSSSSGSENDAFDWEALREGLGPEALAALEAHLAGESREPSAVSASGTVAARDREELNDEFTQRVYWDERFYHEAEYEWLVGYSEICDALRESLPANDSALLEVGCGNSGLQAAMRKDGYTNVLSTDFSEVVVKEMAVRHPELRFAVADATSLKDYADGSFDGVIDKACMDALIAAEGDPWDPSASAVAAANAMCSAVSRVLRPGGVFVQISFAQPHFRRKYLLGDHAAAAGAAAAAAATAAAAAGGGGAADAAGAAAAAAREGACPYLWTLAPPKEVQKEGGCLGYFVYTCTKWKAT